MQLSVELVLQDHAAHVDTVLLAHGNVHRKLIQGGAEAAFAALDTMKTGKRLILSLTLNPYPH